MSKTPPDLPLADDVSLGRPADRIAAGVVHLRLAIWLAVALWCVMPGVWLVFTLVSNASQPAQPQMPMMPRPVFNLTLGMQLMTSPVMMGALFYGAWCAAGVLMGIGLDRTAAAVESVARFWLPAR